MIGFPYIYISKDSPGAKMCVMEGNPSFRVMTQLDPSLSMWFSDHLKNLRRRRCGDDDDDDDDAPAEEKKHACLYACTALHSPTWHVQQNMQPILHACICP